MKNSFTEISCDKELSQNFKSDKQLKVSFPTDVFLQEKNKKTTTTTTIWLNAANLGKQLCKLLQNFVGSLHIESLLNEFKEYQARNICMCFYL